MKLVFDSMFLCGIHDDTSSSSRNGLASLETTPFSQYWNEARILSLLSFVVFIPETGIILLLMNTRTSYYINL